MRDLLERILNNPNIELPSSVREEIRALLDLTDAWAATAAEELKDLGC